MPPASSDIFGAAGVRMQRRDLIHPLDGAFDHRSFLLELRRLLGPTCRHVWLASRFRISLQFAREGCPFLQGPQRRSQSPAEAFVQSETHEFGRISVPDMTAIVRHVALVDLPHRTMAIGAGEGRAT